MMELEEYATLLNDSLQRNETVVFGCKCSVRYSGRAESYLDTGDRLVIIKGDKTLLVHQPSGNAAINYMKPESHHSFVVENAHLLLRSRNILLKETMEVKIELMHFFNSYKLEDGQNIMIVGTEDDMAKMIYSNPELVEKGFKPVSMEEQTKYGYIDVLGTDAEGNLVVVECKRYCADLSAVTQLRRYVEKLMASKGVSHIRGILAAPKITPNARSMLEDWKYKFVSVSPPKYFEEYDSRQRRLDVFKA